MGRLWLTVAGEWGARRLPRRGGGNPSAGARLGGGLLPGLWLCAGLRDSRWHRGRKRWLSAGPGGRFFCVAVAVVAHGVSLPYFGGVQVQECVRPPAGVITDGGSGAGP